jgi:hypothetical protein
MLDECMLAWKQIGDLPDPAKTSQHTTLPCSLPRHDMRGQFLQLFLFQRQILPQLSRTNNLPQVTMILDCHRDGNSRLRRRLDGASARIYGIFMMTCQCIQG